MIESADLVRQSPTKRVRNMKTTYRIIKRIADVVLSAVALAFFLIPFGFIALLIYLDNPGKIFFAQKRVGRNGKLFYIYKFRTMRSDTPAYLSTAQLKNPDQYLTRLGRVLRQLSIDELPQLANVIRGDMSLIGPRPLIPEEEDIHQLRMQHNVYSARPGITGLAQINGRDLTSPEDKVYWDALYVRDCSLQLDLKILFSTIPQILTGRGVVEGYNNKTEEETINKEHK